MNRKSAVRILALVMAALFIGGLLFGVLVPAVYAASGYRAYETPLRGKSRGDNVYIRKAPSEEKGENILQKLSGVKGVYFSFDGESGDFYHTEYEGTAGFVRKDDFRLSSASAKSTPRPSGTAAPSASPGAWKSMGNVEAPAPTPTPDPAAAVSTPQPSRSPEAQSITTESLASGGSAAARSYAVATGGDADVWGRIKIPGAQSYKIYCNALNKDGSDYYYNKDYTHIFAITPQSAQVSVIMGHNMRKSGTMFHALHHVQNAWLGRAKCERCGKACGSSHKASTFDISYNGAEKWELVCFYETEKSEPASTLNYNALSTGDAGSYAARQIERAKASPKGMALTSAGAGDKLMMLITCGDKVGGDTGARLYMLLKAVG